MYRGDRVVGKRARILGIGCQPGEMAGCGIEDADPAGARADPDLAARVEEERGDDVVAETGRIPRIVAEADEGLPVRLQAQNSPAPRADPEAARRVEDQRVDVAEAAVLRLVAPDLAVAPDLEEPGDRSRPDRAVLGLGERERRAHLLERAGGSHSREGASARVAP